MSKKEELSFEKVWAMFQEVRELQKETDRQMKETDRQMKETVLAQKETAQAQKETVLAQKETAQAQKEAVLAQKETEKLLQKETEKLQKENALARKENEKRLSWIDKQLGDIGRSMGEIVELVVIPGICKKMNVYGYCFTRIGPNKIIDRENGKTLTEIDLMLENGKESMAVEIKTDLSVKWVNRHLERLKLLRKNESITGLKGKVLYGAVAGISIDTDARELALENGMYVISIIENEDRLEVTAPAKRNIGKW